MPKNNNLWGLTQSFVLASASPQRRRLLENAGLYPAEIVSADIDETPRTGELPARYVQRMAIEKAAAVARTHPGVCIVAADTVIAVGRRLIRKAETEEQARANLDLLSGRRHRVMTGFCVRTADGRTIAKTVQTTVVLKRLDERDKQAILDSGEWQHVAGYRIEGVLSACVREIIGSHPNIVGLPVFQVAQVLKGILRAP